MPVIALTADAISGDYERYLAEGMDCCISKPIDKLDLLIEVQKLVGVETAPGVSRRAPTNGENTSPESEIEAPRLDQELANLLAEKWAPRRRGLRFRDARRRSPRRLYISMIVLNPP